MLTVRAPRHRLTAMLAVAALTVVGTAAGLARRAPVPAHATGLAAAPIYADAFGDPSSGWPQSDDGTVSYGYVDGTYQIEVKSAEHIGWALNGPDTGDQDTEVEVRALNPTGDQDYGLVFRARDIDNFYLFQVNPFAGSYNLYRRVAGRWQEMIPPTDASAVRSGGAVNRLRVLAVGNNIALRVNGTELTTVTDATFASGKFGLSMQNLGVQGATAARFDNLTAYAPGRRPAGMAVLLPALLNLGTFARPGPGPGPTPTPEPEQAGIYGRLTVQGQPAAGTALVLRMFDDQREQTVDQTTTAPDGSYAFTGVPDLPDGKTYYVRFGPNTTDESRVFSWYGPDLTAYQAGERLHGGDFDIGDIALLAPEPDATVRSPATFRWQARPLDDTYRWRLFEPNGTASWSTNDLGHVAEAIINAPADLVLNQDYGWSVRAFLGPTSYGDAFYYRVVRFEAAAAPALPLAAPALPLARGALEDRKERRP